MIVAYRIADYDAPFWVSPNRSESRFNRSGEAPTQYMSLHPLGPWAEFLRMEGIRDPAEVEMVRHRTWALRLEIDAADIYDLTFDRASDWGLTPDELVADDYTSCQNLASDWRSGSGTPSVFIAPSAALPGTKSLVILGPRVAIPYSWTVINPLAQGAAGPTTGNGVSTAQLVEGVRYRGEPHPELEAWKAGLAFDCRLTVAGSVL